MIKLSLIISILGCLALACDYQSKYICLQSQNLDCPLRFGCLQEAFNQSTSHCEKYCLLFNPSEECLNWCMQLESPQEALFNDSQQLFEQHSQSTVESLTQAEKKQRFQQDLNFVNSYSILITFVLLIIASYMGIYLYKLIIKKEGFDHIVVDSYQQFQVSRPYHKKRYTQFLKEKLLVTDKIIEQDEEEEDDTYEGGKLWQKARF